MALTQVRFIRQKDAPEFFGVTRQTFDRTIRPYLVEIWLGDTAQSGIVYDIYDLNARADIIRERNGRPAKKGANKWDAKQPVLSLSNDRGPHTGTLKELSSKDVLGKALAQHQKKKQP